MSSDYNWNYSITFPPSGSQYDWLTVMLHEITHGLGFSALINSEGKYIYTTSSGSAAETNFPGIFDRQLYRGTSGPNLPDLTQSQREALVESNNLYSGRPESHLLVANGDTRVKMFAPYSWIGGSSVSHWDDSVTFPTFMKRSAAAGFRCIVINAREIAIMLDMGWTCLTTVDFTNQNVTTDTIVTSCGDINVQNVKVQNGAKLIFDAAGNVNIISGFEVELESSFEIK